MRQKREQAIVSALAFLIPGLVVLWAYASLGFAPWGDRSVLVSDMSSQYVDFFCALKNGDFSFSWSKALGSGYIGVFSYYVSSPLSFLTLLVPNEAMPIGLMFLTVLKIALAGLSFAVYAQRRFPGCSAPALLCAVCYALMSYNAAYSLCVMWLDGPIWLPLILLALERILAGGGAGPFIAALTVCFLSTWYISWMIGIFCVLYLCARLVALMPRRKALYRVFVRFFGGAACALGLTAWMWLPTFLAMFGGKFSGGNQTDYANVVSCSPIHVLGQFLPGQYGPLDNGALPYVFCGTGMLALVAAYFLFWDPYHREKLANQVVLFLLFASMVFAPLDKAWHLFQLPNWFPFRYAFLLSFFVLYLAVQALWLALAALEKKRGRCIACAAASALVLFAMADMGMNTRGMLANMQERYGSDSYQYYHNNYTVSARLTDVAWADAAGAFHRMGAVGDRGQNGPLAFGYPGITHYSSLYNYDLNRLLKSLGFAQDWYWGSYHGSTPLTDALFDIQYVISAKELPGYEAIAQEGSLALWKNPNVLPLAFAAQDGVRGLEGETVFDRQNSLVSGLLGAEIAVFTPAEAETDIQPDGITFTLTGKGRPIYVDLSALELQEVLVNGARVAALGGVYTAHTYCLGTPQEGEAWTVTIRGPNWPGQLWECDLDILHAAVEEVTKAQVVSVDSGGRVRLAVQSGGSPTLLTTIPAEDGWSAYVDGERTETRKWLDVFLSLELPTGAHQVELRYIPPGLIPGLALGVLSLLALAAVDIRRSHTGREGRLYSHKSGT